MPSMLKKWFRLSTVSRASGTPGAFSFKDRLSYRAKRRLLVKRDGRLVQVKGRVKSGGQQRCNPAPKLGGQ